MRKSNRIVPGAKEAHEPELGWALQAFRLCLHSMAVSKSPAFGFLPVLVLCQPLACGQSWQSLRESLRLLRLLICPFQEGSALQAGAHPALARPHSGDQLVAQSLALQGKLLSSGRQDRPVACDKHYVTMIRK